MKVRFNRGHVWLEPEFPVPPKMPQAEAAALIELGDEDSRKKVIEGHLWLAVDIASRFLYKLQVDKRQGENLGADLMSVGFMAITDAVYHLKKCPRNVRAYLSAAIEKRQSEHLDCDNLCSVPPRTQRDRIAKGKPPIVPPKIRLATDLAFDRKESNTSVLSRLTDGHCRGDSERPDDLHDYGQDQIDDDILELRYNGADPGAIAKIAGDSRGTEEERLNQMETRAYDDLDRPIPSGKRTKGKRLHKPRAQAKVETAMPASPA